MNISQIFNFIATFFAGDQEIAICLHLVMKNATLNI